MTYEEAVAIIKTEDPSLTVLPQDGGHVAIKRPGSAPPHCITLPNSEVGFPNLTPEERVAMETASLKVSILQMPK